ncbi:MAG TPA: hypothetical protein DER60_10050 [Syntrophomonas sp.]|mgnify:CR=1 FL=1|jgi:Na+-translocating ferredoxin:NAD+ oxidoreductase RnfG subunit|nr:hypothetical protein [Syntrophomonas sp.]
MLIRKLGLLLVLMAAAALLGCGESSQPTAEELKAVNEIFTQDYTAGDLTVITDEFMTADRKDKFQAVKKVFTTPEGDYAFICKPVAYNGPITLAIGIDKDSDKTTGMRIVSHMETEHYVRDMNNSWFTQRFADKSSQDYLQLVHLEAKRDNEIIIITGATVTTEAIANGVNACMGIFREAVLGQSAEAVPYMVKFEKSDAEGPEENGKLAVRSYGTILGEVTLEQIREMPSVKRTMMIHSTSGTTSHSFRGTLLSNVIAIVDPGLLTGCEMVQPVGVDDYMSNISMDEVLKENAVYVMYEDNGEPLKTKDGKPGAMRVVVLDDVFGQRFTNYMIEIVVE